MSDAIDPVAVIGGGIAGAVASLRLKALGFDPLWIAPEPELEDKPGEHLAPAARSLLARIDAEHLLDRPCHREANAMLSAWGSNQIGERNAIVNLDGPGRVLDRVAFERDLVDLTTARGVKRISGMVDAVAREDNHWCLSLAGEARRVGFVLDASGRSAVIARDQSQRFRADQLAALVMFIEQDTNSDVAPTKATLIEAVAHGWWYASLLGDGRLALNYYSDPDLLPRDATRDPSVFRSLLRESLYIGRWVEEADFQVTGTPRLASAGTTWIAPAAGEGWAAIGDAAAAFDPLSSHGMTTALWTALSAAEAVPAAIANDESDLKSYVAKVADGVQAYLKSRDEVYAAEKRFADTTFWRRRTVRDQETMGIVLKNGQ